jgi:pimeloyl-ACP methyl ester carboxylesterase
MMPSFSIPRLPSQTLINGLSSIPPPPASDFDKHFGGFLPERHILDSALGQTAYYLLSSTSTSASDPAPSTTPGKESAVPVRRAILMHGSSTPCINLLPLADALLSSPAQRTEILLYDLWGHGLSSTPLLPPTLGIFHFQLLALLSHLRWSDPAPHLLGFSYSGSIAVSFAAVHPSLLSSVSLIAPTGLLRSSSIPSWTQLVRSGGPFGLWSGAARSNILQLIDDGSPPVPPADWRSKIPLKNMEAVQVWQRETHRGHVALLVGLYHSGGRFDLHDEYARVANGPLGRRKLVVLGEHDEMLGGERTKKELKLCGWNDYMVEVKDVDHLIVRWKPDETAELLGKFWSACEED